MVSIRKHPNKEIQAAIDFAISKGWRIIKAGSSAHAFCRIYCPENNRNGCKLSIYSTPRSAKNHARLIVRRVNDCPHNA